MQYFVEISLCAHWFEVYENLLFYALMILLLLYYMLSRKIIWNFILLTMVWSSYYNSIIIMKDIYKLLSMIIRLMKQVALYCMFHWCAVKNKQMCDK